jgi:tRNA-Thr(GGU) m(6)t(6)A37 methyltransferase TsaA
MPKKGGARREHRDGFHRVREDGRREAPPELESLRRRRGAGCNEAYKEGLGDIEPGQRIVVIFNFHESPAFSPDLLRQTPPQRRQGPPGVNRSMGIFSICSPMRPNPIGMSVLEVLGVEGNVVHVRGLDMRDGSPILDIKPYLLEDRRDRQG